MTKDFNQTNYVDFYYFFIIFLLSQANNVFKLNNAITVQCAIFSIENATQITYFLFSNLVYVLGITAQVSIKKTMLI